MPVEPASPDELDRLSQRIERWTRAQLAENEIVAAVDRDPQLRRWYVRLRGEEKATMTVWLTLRERTLAYESYFMPAPEENAEELYALLLRLNTRLFALRFAIGEEDAVFLLGQLPVTAVDEDELDRIVGSVFAYSEQWFRPAMRLGHPRRFR